MAKRRPRHGQNAQARTVAGAVLVSLAVLITGLMFFQTFDRKPDHVGALSAVGAAALITTWQVWRQKRRARLGAAERPPAEPPGYTSAEPPPTEDTRPCELRAGPTWTRSAR
jgi:hypothetical protein